MIVKRIFGHLASPFGRCALAVVPILIFKGLRYFLFSLSFFCPFFWGVNVEFGLQLVAEMASNDPLPLLPKDQWSEDFQEFLDLCLEKDPQNRATAQVLLQVMICYSCFCL